MNLGAHEIILVLMVVVLLFGAKRLPELGRGLGIAVREFRRGMSRDDEEKGPKSDPSESE